MYTTTTLQAFLKALPGELKIPANFPEATVEITQFEDVKKAGGRYDWKWGVAFFAKDKPISGPGIRLDPHNRW